MRILFILKRQLVSGGYSAPGRACGLFNSATFVSDMLRDELGHTTKLVVVQDNNSIDREVTLFRPDIVIIEALWVTPTKMKVLRSMHRNVIWLIRNHSAMPFLAHEGIAIDWLLTYPRITNVYVADNDPRTQHELQALLLARGIEKPVLLTPNYYPPEFHPRHLHIRPHLNIGCFGAIRPLKNQLIQAVAAIKYAEQIDKPLNFHINGTRLEGNGDPILKNLRQLFIKIPKHTLVEYPWMERHEFIHTVRRLDLAMQCSFTESFNLVTADAVMNDVPVVVSPEISWVSPRFQAAPTNSRDIVNKIDTALRFARQHPQMKPNRDRLRQFDIQSILRWGEAIDMFSPCG